MPLLRQRRTLGAVTPADFERLGALRRMQAIAVGLLIAMGIVFVISYILQDRIPWLGYVRAASEGGMVGAIADWFAVTALFRHPLGLKIPHTNLIAQRKDEIGEGLGTFIEENFLADDVVHNKLAEVSGARMAGTWLLDREHAARTGQVIADVGIAALTVLDDRDVQDFLESLAREHVVDPAWSPLLGRATTSFLEGNHHEALIDMAADRLEQWLIEHPHAFDRWASSRLPSWVPSVVDRFVDQRLHTEATRFVHAVASDRQHPLRATITDFLTQLGQDLTEQPALQEQVEAFKHEIFDSPRIRSLAESTWTVARTALLEMLQDPHSDFRKRLTHACSDFGARLLDDTTLQFKVDTWVMQAVEHLVHTYRHDLARVVSDTVERWDAREAAEKIELQIGKDLQFIRINGTVIGALAGLTIYAVATLVIGPLAGVSGG